MDLVRHECETSKVPQPNRIEGKLWYCYERTGLRGHHSFWGALGACSVLVFYLGSSSWIVLIALYSGSNHTCFDHREIYRLKIINWLENNNVYECR